ncbi:hypothetical protein [Saccharospirillum mangrovi]|uniref:hypothetical protein n=1 Tax=Saccharospirillum mangrovi TaxID=2161747 RepID=UPI000D36AC1E|nr:hypothetical protein [Saccharospirillum mangrovi]
MNTPLKNSHGTVGRGLKRNILALAISAAAAGNAVAALPVDSDIHFDLELEANRTLHGFDMTPLPNGQFAIVWAEEEAGNGGRIQLQRFDSLGAAVGERLEVYRHSSATDFPTRPAIAASEQGQMVVAWSISGNQAECNDETDLMVRTISPVDALTSVSVPAVSVPCSVDVAMDADGDFALLWGDGDNRNDMPLKIQTYLADGSKAMASPIQVANSYRDGSLAMDADGRLMVAWAAEVPPIKELDGLDFSTIVVGQRYDLFGNALGTDFRLDNNVNGGFGIQLRPGLSLDADQGLVVAWGEYDPTKKGDIDMPVEISMRGQRWKADGSVGETLDIGFNDLKDVLEDGSANTAMFSMPSLGSDSEGNLLVAWSQDPGPYNPSLAQFTAFDGDSQLIGERQNNFGDMELPQIGLADMNAGRVAVSDDLRAIAFAKDEQTVSVRMLHDDTLAAPDATGGIDLENSSLGELDTTDGVNDASGINTVGGTVHPSLLLLTAFLSLFRRKGKRVNQGRGVDE